MSMTFVPKGQINNNPLLTQIMAWRRPGDKSSSELMMVRSPTHTCVTRPQWVNTEIPRHGAFHRPSYSLITRACGGIMTYTDVHSPIISMRDMILMQIYSQYLAKEPHGCSMPSVDNNYHCPGYSFNAIISEYTVKDSGKPSRPAPVNISKHVTHIFVLRHSGINDPR